MTSYLSTAEGLRKRYARLAGHPSADWRDVALWAQSHLRLSVCGPTWRVYRSAIRRAAADPDVDAILANLPSPIRDRSILVRRSRMWTAADLASFQRWLSQGHKSQASLANSWLNATLHSGLRPCEWSSASHDVRDGQPGIYVMSAKAANRHASAAVFRWVPLRLPDEITLEHVEQTLSQNRIALEQGGQAGQERLFRSVQALFSRAGREIWGARKTRPTLYTARHEFAQRLLEEGETIDTVAERLGDTPDTVWTYYCAQGPARLQRNRQSEPHRPTNTRTLTSNLKPEGPAPVSQATRAAPESSEE